MQINFGSGDFKFPNAINVDAHEAGKPDVVCDLRTSNFPFKDGEADVIYAIHSLEHIEVKYWDHILEEFYRVLKEDGKLYLAYPEFEVCSRYYTENHRGSREFWRATLYGRQLYPGDYHVVPMRTQEVVKFLEVHGFVNIKFQPEQDEDWSTFVACVKGPKFSLKEDVLRKEIFG